MENIVQPIIDAAREGTGPEDIKTPEGFFLGKLWPDGRHFEKMEGLNRKPYNKGLTIELLSMESFLLYLHRYHDPKQTVVYADSQATGFTAVFDDYPKGAAQDPAWRKHRASYQLRPSSKLKEWMGRGSYTSQQEFAEFLNFHAGEIVSPAAADIIECVLQFEAVEMGSFQSKSRPRDGTIQFRFEKETKVLSVDVPETMTINVPLFEETPPCQLTAQLRFRIQERALKFSLVFPDLADQLKAYWDKLLAGLADKLPAEACLVLGKAS